MEKDIQLYQAYNEKKSITEYMATHIKFKNVQPATRSRYTVCPHIPTI